MDKKQQAIQAAIELFATQGFEKNVYRTGASMSLRESSLIDT